MNKKDYVFLAFLALIIWASLYLNALPRPNTQITYWDVYWGITEGIFFNIYCALSEPRQFKRFVTEQEAIVSSELIPIRCILQHTITIIKYTQTHLCTKVQICPMIYVFGGNLMPKTKCSNCGETIEYSNSFCSKCGSEMPKNQIIELNKEYSEKICSRYSALQELLESHKQAIRKLSLTPWDGFMTTASNSDFVKAYGGCLNKDGTVEYKGISKAKLSDILLMCEALFSQCMYEQKNEGNIHSEDYRSYLASLSGLNTINDPEAKETCLNLAKSISKFVLYMEYIDQALTKLEEDAKRLLKGYLQIL